MTPLQKAEARETTIRGRLTDAQDALRRVSVLAWSVVVFGSIPPLVGVTRFATGQKISGYVAWMLDPAAIATIAASVLAAQALARFGVRPGRVLAALPWAAGSLTLGLNTWTSWNLDGADAHDRVDWGGVLAHGGIPLLMIGMIHGLAVAREKFAGVIADQLAQLAAAEDDVQRHRDDQAADAARRVELEEFRAAEQAKSDRDRQDEARRHEQERLDRLAREEREHELELARISVAAGVVPNLQGVPAQGRMTAEELEAIHEEYADRFRADADWVPDYEAMQERHGRKKRWCEGVIEQARKRAAGDQEDGEAA